MVWLVILLGLLACPGISETHPRIDESDDEAVLGTLRLRIPEPMVFDLVRPLGARERELEINSLGVLPLTRRRTLNWAPEVEYTLFDGFGVEFELPAENTRVTHYKMAVQGTLNTWTAKKFIHGWQGIGEIGRDGEPWSAVGLYLTGYRFNRRWSLLSMHGLKWEGLEHVETSVLANHTVFYQSRRAGTLGFETNLELQRRRAGVLLMPQKHVELGAGIHLQAGLGVVRPMSGPTRPALGFRLIKEL
ncbi:MAG: hypothetical protein IPM24_00645 [Bryobacterales bacterium]|nr:hypothetical protein [Bryobacterales bacterium]